MGGEIVSLDLGSTYTKAAIHAGPRVRFASVCEPGAGGIMVDGTRWLVGDDALDAQKNPRNKPHEGTDYHGGPRQRVLLCEALRRLGGEHVYDMLVLALPYSLRDAATRKRVRDAYQSLTWHDDSGEHCATFQNIIITPQGGGALWHYLHANPGCAGQLACAVDIGGETTDIVTARLGQTYGDERVMSASSDSPRVNVMSFYRALLRRLSPRMPGRVFDFFAVMGRIEAGQMTLGYRGKQVPIDAEVSATRTEFTLSLLAQVQDTVGARWDDLDVIILTGGGASLVDRTVWDDPRTQTQNDAYSNVTGQLLPNDDLN